MLVSAKEMLQKARDGKYKRDDGQRIDNRIIDIFFISLHV